MKGLLLMVGHKGCQVYVHRWNNLKFVTEKGWVCVGWGCLNSMWKERKLFRCNGKKTFPSATFFFRSKLRLLKSAIKNSLRDSESIYIVNSWD